MVFMSSSVLSWRPVLQAWLQKLAELQASALKHCFDCCYQVRAAGTQLDLFIILILGTRLPPGQTYTTKEQQSSEP